MISDAQGEDYKPIAAGIHLYIEDCDAVYKRAMEAGATSIMEPPDQFYGDRSAGVRRVWQSMVDCHSQRRFVKRRNCQTNGRRDETPSGKTESALNN